MIFGNIIGPKGKIFFFEPYEKSRDILIKNIYINELSDISTVYPVATGNKKMTGYLFIDYENTGATNVES